MSDTKEYLVQAVKQGTVNISEDVIAAIAAVAIRDVDGVTCLANSFSKDLAERFGIKSLVRDVKLTLVENTVTVDCYVVLNYGTEIPAVATAIQDNVISTVESMTGLKVAAVNVNVCGISIPKE